MSSSGCGGYMAEAAAEVLGRAVLAVRPRSPGPRSRRTPSPARQPRRSLSPPQVRYASAVPEDGERWEMGVTGADDRWTLK